MTPKPRNVDEALDVFETLTDGQKKIALIELQKILDERSENLETA